MTKKINSAKQKIKEKRENVHDVTKVYRDALKSFERDCAAYLQSKGA